MDTSVLYLQTIFKFLVILFALSIQSVLFSLHALLLEHQYVSQTFFMKYTLKLLKLFNITIAVCKRILKIYELPYIHLRYIHIYIQCVSRFVILQHLGRVATPTLVSKNCFKYLQTTLIMGGGELVSKLVLYI